MDKDKIDDLTKLSMDYLKVKLYDKYGRKSERKVFAVDIGSNKTPENSEGIYLRLSSKDSDNKDSIHNQKAIIEHYLEAYPEIKVFKHYVDDGVSSYKRF